MDCNTMMDGVATKNDEYMETKHTIFLNHSGAQKDFVEQLCVDIERCDRIPFFDKRRDSLPIGEHFPNHIFQAIKKCQVGVVILSKEFFTRTKWPMLELVALVQSKKQNKKLVIIPVFLGISRSCVRNPIIQEDWLKVWCDWAGSDKRINIGDWKRALEIFGPTIGLSYDDKLGEVKLRHEILEEICKRVHPESKWNLFHVQGKIRLSKVVCEIIERDEACRIDGVRLVGLYGVGGLGKTTICRVMCKELYGKFCGRVCHIELESKSELELLQEALKRLTDTRKEVVEQFNTDECKVRLEKTLYREKVFLAIDNVTDNLKTIEQALTFLQARKMEGSVVIVTARSLGQLKKLCISDHHCHAMPELEVDEARSLFLSNAQCNEQNYPSKKRKLNKDDEEVIRHCVERCRFRKGDGFSLHYHPLALKVLGVQLMGYDIGGWHAQLDDCDPFNMLQHSEHPIFSILGKSFDALIPIDKLFYMDVVLFCSSATNSIFRKGSVSIFEWLSVVHGISVPVAINRLKILKTKSLIEEVGDGYRRIGLHDLWREFCIMETRRQGQDSKHWVYEKSSPNTSQANDLNLPIGGWINLQQICLIGANLCTFHLNGLDLSCCPSVTILKLEDVNFGFKVLDVRPLKWLKSMEIVRCRMNSNSCIQIVGLELLRNLRILILDPISNGSSCEVFGYLYELQILRLASSGDSTAMNIQNSKWLSTFQSIYNRMLNGANFKLFFSPQMTNLRYLNISACERLRSCRGVEHLVGLVELDLSYCWNLEELPNLQKLTNLREFNMRGCESVKALAGLGDLVALEKYNASYCWALAELPDMRNLSNLRELDLFGCQFKTAPGLWMLNALQQPCYGGLEEFDLHMFTKLEKLTNDGDCSKLLQGVHMANVLSLSLCSGIVDIELVGLHQWTKLRSLSLFGCNVKDVSGLSYLAGLEDFDISLCDQLEWIPDLHKLTRLVFFIFAHCRSLREWRGWRAESIDGKDVGSMLTLPMVRNILIWNCPITEVPDLSSFPSLHSLDLDRCRELRRVTSMMPLASLNYLNLEECTSLEAVPDFSSCVHLRYTSFTGVRCEVKLPPTTS